MAAGLEGRRDRGAGLPGAGRGGVRLDEAQLKVLEAELNVGPAAHGWMEDQRWTLARVAALIWELFRVRCCIWVVPRNAIRCRWGIFSLVPRERSVC